ncbi:MAG TPA: hypothetical protein VFF06_29590 [Polyangia bacterium]|nr:hypothetical protein [Polyangia bacterium]
MRLALVACVAFAGCGFRGTAPPDDASAPLDLTTAGDGASAGDFAMPMGGSGPGPLGALPTGYCCSASEQCRSRQCINLGSGPYYCADVCTDATPCSGFSTQYQCDTAIDTCTPVNDPYTCIDGATYQHGGKPNGACCSGKMPQSGEECLGGLCLQTGDASNPYYCSQGCNDLTPCPTGYTCKPFGITTKNPGQCWLTATTYTCQ